MAAATTSLAFGFATPDRSEWLALVERTLKGADIGTLTRLTIEGLAIEPLYAPADAQPIPGRATLGWDVRSLVRNGGAADANAQILEDLAGGAHSVLLRLGPSAIQGAAIGSAEAMARALDGVVLEAAPVALDAGFLGRVAADWLAAAAKGAPAAQLALHLDPLSAFAAAGSSPGPVEAHLIACATVGARLCEPYPQASLFLASGRAAHEAGAGEAAELAMAMTSALAYAHALTRAGLEPAEAFRRIVVGVSLDADYFLGVAKLRAARLVWGKITAACGAAAPAIVEARSSARMLTRVDAWTNLIRLAAAGFAGAVGGADALVLGAFTDAIGPPTAFARRQSRNTQLVLMEEASLGRVVDPAGGSGYVEAMTDEMARAAWERLQSIEARGGIIPALEQGLVAEWAAEGRDELKRRIAARELKVLGVTDFPAAADQPPETARPDAAASDAHSLALPGPDSRCPALAAIRLEELA